LVFNYIKLTMRKHLDDPLLLAIILIKLLAPWISNTPPAGEDNGFCVVNPFTCSVLGAWSLEVKDEKRIHGFKADWKNLMIGVGLPKLA
jgi:hypothetical protein